ncbi:MAG: magnesium transporter CorA family protein [Alphaproteobacteria bacterium]|nr:magnesium transporter CorA family protein [Alphaproteobacteria bacterium]
MINAYKTIGDSFKTVPQEDIKAQSNDIFWVDLFHPTSEEESFIESWLGVNIPTHDKMHEIEQSSRLYQHDQTLFMTLTMLTHADTPQPESHDVSFVIHNNILITTRYVNTQPFDLSSHENISKDTYKNGSALLTWMLDKIIDHLADTLESIAKQVEETGRQIFDTQDNSSTSPIKFRKVISSIGLHQNLLSITQEGLFSATRLLSFISEMPLFKEPLEKKAVHSMMRDLPPLIEHATFLSNKINFLLDATLGMINIEQNTIIKIVSLATVVFLPPTLVASVYGMNFHSIPELQWEHGYPFAIILMVLAGFLPYAYFKFKKWF